MKEPYLQAAVLCERVLEEKDGSLSPIRIVDAVVNRGPREFVYPVTALVIVRPNGVEGEIPVRIELEAPSGAITPLLAAKAQGRRQNLIMNMQVKFRESGLHYFNVYVKDKLATRIPFTIISTGGTSDGLAISDFVKGQLTGG